MLLRNLLLCAITASTASAQYFAAAGGGGLHKRTPLSKRQQVPPSTGNSSTVVSGDDGGDGGSGADVPAAAAIPEAQNFTAAVDWSDKAKGTFNNRYWIDEQAYEDGGPVIFQSLGEFPGEASLNNLGETMALTIANKTRGLIVYFEHRYYGQSIPDIENPADLVSQPAKLKDWIGQGLSVENALEDISQFAKGFEFDGNDLSAGKVPWIMMGSSYAGAVVAWARKRNPEVAFAVLASSAVVELVEEDKSYNQAIEDYTKSQYSNCTADLTAFMAWQTDIYNNDDTAAFESWMTAIGATNGTDLRTFLTAQQAVTGGTTQRDQVRAVSRAHNELLFREFLLYGPTEGQIPTFCDTLQSSALKKHPDLSADSIKESGIVAALDNDFDKASPLIFATFKSLWETYLTSLGPAATQSSPPVKELCGQGVQVMCKTYISLVAWSYQRCFELGTALTANGPPSAIRPEFDNLDSARADCALMFGGGGGDGGEDIMPSLAPKQYNGDWSNTLFLDGEHDPWLGVTPNAEDAVPKPEEDPIPDEGEEKLFGKVAADAFHSSTTACTAWLERGQGEIDMEETAKYQEGDTTCGPEVAESQQLFLSALDKWLPEFEEHSLDDGYSGGGNGTASDGGNGSGSGSGSGNGNGTVSVPTPGSGGANGGGEEESAALAGPVPKVVLALVAAVGGVLAGTWDGDY